MPREIWLEDVNKAQIDSPGGMFCGRCNKLNDNADDCGWFYWWKDRKSPLVENVNYIAVCNKCWDELGLSTAER